MACGGASEPHGDSSSSTTTQVPAATALHPWLTEAEIEKAIAFRRSVGLRLDRAWIEAVATRPDAEAGVRTFGVPLTGPEREGLLARARTAEAVTSVIQRYGQAHPEVWAGVHIEDGLVVGRFTGVTAVHEDELRSLLGPNAHWEVRGAHWTLAEMQDLRDRIAHDGWLRTEGYDLLDLGADLRANVVQLHVSSGEPDAAGRIARHYNAGDMLVVTSDGTGVTSVPTGGLGGVVLDWLGQPVAGLDVEVIGDIPGSGPRGDRGVETDSRGEFEVKDIPATSYEVRLLDPTAADGTYLEGAARTLVRTFRVSVQPGATTYVQVTLDNG